MANFPEHPVARALLDVLPPDGSSGANAKLRYAVAARLGREITEAEYATARDALVEAGLAVKGKGRGGSLCRAVPAREGPAAAHLELTSEPQPIEPFSNLQLFMDSPITLGPLDIRTWLVTSGSRVDTMRVAINHLGTREEVDRYVELPGKIVQEQAGELAGFVVPAAILENRRRWLA